jgi:nucleoside-diphosphate-sugar epimerase
MRVIVLGGTRFIGRAVVVDLAAAGHEVLLVHRGLTERDDLPAVAHLHVERAHLGDRTDALRAFRPDAFIDCMALTRADAEVVVRTLPEGLHGVVLSSCDVYRAFGSLLAGIETDGVPITEESPVRVERYPYRELSADRYDYDKLDVEGVYLPHGVISLRLPMVYGERDYQRREEFILRRVRAGRDRIPVGAGAWLPCRGYVGDVARGARRALETPEAGGEVFNLGDEPAYSVGFWARMILDAAGSRAELVRVPDERLPADLEETGGVSQHIAATSRKARQHLGFTTGDPAANLRRTVAWHLANPPEADRRDFAADDAALAP